MGRPRRHPTDPDEATRLRHDAQAAAREAKELAERAALLEVADADRAAWYAATAVTRDNAERARAELRARGVDLDHPDDRTTAQDWLAAHTAAKEAEDAHREIHEHELVDRDTPAAGPQLTNAAGAGVVVETAVPDIRDTSTPDPTEKTDPTHRDYVPDVDETDASVKRAQAALVEVAARAVADAERVAEEEAARQEELTRWSTEDNTSHDAEPAYEY